MISNQPAPASPAAAGLVATPGDAARSAPADAGAASIFAALLGQLFQTQPVAIPLPMATAPEQSGTGATSGENSPEGEQATEASVIGASSESQASSGSTEATASTAPVAAPALPVVVAPAPVAVPTVFTPRAPRTVTSAINAALRPPVRGIAGEARFAPLKGAPANGGGVKRGEETTQGNDPSSAMDSASANASVMAGAMLQASAAAQLVTTPSPTSTSERSDAADAPTPEASSSASAATAAANAPGTSATPNGGLGAASPMVRAMTLLLDALGVTDRKAAARDAAPADDATPMAAPTERNHESLPPSTTSVLGEAKAVIAPAIPGSEVKGKLDAQAENLPGGKQPLPGSVVSLTPGSEQSTGGQGDSRDRHDSRDGSHRATADVAGGLGASDQGASSWSSALGGAIRQDGGASSSEVGRAGATAYVPRSEPTPQPASTSQVTMDLDPTMGTLGRIRVAVRGETVHATITTKDNDAAALGVRAHELRLALEQRGFSDARVTVRSTGTEDAPAAVIASSVSDLKPRALDTASGRNNSDTHEQPRGDRRDQAGGDRPDTRRQRNRQEQPQ